uniref:Rel homology dimerisation domain-containing protein n=1 Tax=Meloidogyne enterolobii TaxID=390850 RepID=A0A6V7WVY3_MELEN|nr:unnamed protein product [Meloidogyne enterolobii]
MHNEHINSEQNWIWDESIQQNNNLFNNKQQKIINNQQLNYEFWQQQNSSQIKITKNDNLNLYNSNTGISSQIQNNPSRELVVIRQPEEQHRARYASEGSRGAVKDRSGTSYCSIQLNGYYRPTRVEIFAAEREYSSNVSSFVPHSQYKLVPVLGKSATMTPCRKIIKNNGSECLEIILRPENRMIGILDCIGIMKICAYNNNKTVNNNYERKRHSKNRKRSRQLNNNEDNEEYNQQKEKYFEKEYQNNNILYIVAKAFLPLEESNKEDKQNFGKVENYEIIEAVTEPIKCVHQVGNPDILKISLESCPSNGGQELFIIGRNFDPKDTNVLFREYKNDGSLGWTAKALIDKRFLHQCYIVCTIPPYRSNCRGATVSLTVVCGSKQSHPINFLYTTCEVEDDDWRPPDCSFSSNAECSSSSQLTWSSSIAVPHQQETQNYFYDETQKQQLFNNSFQNENYLNKNNFDIHPFIFNSSSRTSINQQ